MKDKDLVSILTRLDTLDKQVGELQWATHDKSKNSKFAPLVTLGNPVILIGNTLSQAQYWASQWAYRTGMHITCKPKDNTFRGYSKTTFIFVGTLNASDRERIIYEIGPTGPADNEIVDYT